MLRDGKFGRCVKNDSLVDLAGSRLGSLGANVSLDAHN
jgi:hypothetical protein